jgi:sugar/nucleoside kinase (ribokinase family)
MQCVYRTCNIYRDVDDDKEHRIRGIDANATTSSHRGCQRTSAAIPAFVCAPMPLPWRPSADPSSKPRRRCPCACARLDIATLGNAALDIVVQAQRLPSFPGDHASLRRDGVSLSLGGAFNCLIAASRLGARAAPVAFVADRPDDHITNHLVSAAARAGFATCDGLVRRVDATTQTCVVFVDADREHTFLATNELPVRPAAGDSNRYQDSRVRGTTCMPEVMAAVIRQATVLIIDGYAIAGEPDLVASALAHCTRPSLQVWLDPQAVGAALIASQDCIFCKTVAVADGVCLTLDEARAMLGRDGSCDGGRRSSDSAVDVVQSLAEANLFPKARIVLVKLGAGGCVIAERVDPGSLFACEHIPGFVVEPVDSTGCGDAFIGSFLAIVLQNACSLSDAAVVANAAGAATSLLVGAGERGIASREHVITLLQQSQRGRDVLGLVRHP